MRRETPVEPTRAEFRILQVLWGKGPCTVRQVHESLDGDTGYTTILKLMQIMLEKGLLSRDETKRTHLYAAAVPEGQTKGGVVRDVIERLFGGSAKDLILQALSTRKSSRRELAEIRQMIETLERKK